MTKDEALKMAIEALAYHPSEDVALQACKEALEQPAQEPVAWYWNNNHRDKIPYAGVERGNPKMDVVYGTPIPLYTHPAPSWQGLSDDDITKAVLEIPATFPSIFGIARAIEQALRNKNHG